MPSDVSVSPVVVPAGDVPLITPATNAAHTTSGAAATMLTMEFEDPTGDAPRVAETKAAGDPRRTLPSVERSRLA